MICCFGHSFSASAGLRFAGKIARAMAGVADYDAYLAHLAANHPDQTPLSQPAFFAERQAVRYGAGGLRCC